MAESMEEMAVRITGDARNYQMAVQASVDATKRLEQTVQASSSKVTGIANTLTGYGQTVQNVLLGLAASMGINGFLGTVQSAIGKAIDTEQTEIAFRSLIGSGEEAMNLLADLRQFAVKTPFEVPQILGAAKQMLAYGQSVNEILPTMQRLGDVASGLNIPLGQLAYLYGTLKSSGRVMTVDMRQFAGRGIPIWLYLAKAIGMVTNETRRLTGEQSAQLAQMVTKGQVNFQMIEKAFDLMVSKGGNFFKMMEDQSFSLGGIISNLSDSLGLLLADVGKQVIEGFDLKRVVKEVGAMAQTAADWFKNMDPTIKKTIFLVIGVVAALGGVVAAVLTLKLVFAGLAAVIATVGWPFIVVAGLVIAAIAVWVDSVGGISKAMDVAKEKALQFWEFVRPVFYALWELVKTVAIVIRDVFVAVGEAISSVWKAVFGESTDIWTAIRNHIVDKILLIAFFFQNFTDVMSAAWNRLVYIILDGINRVTKVAAPWITAVANLDQQVARMKKRSDALRSDIAQRFKKFKEDALKVTPDMVRPDPEAIDRTLSEAGKKGGDAFKKGLKEALQDVDSVLFGSAESMRRLDNYLERLKNAGRAVGKGVGAAMAQAMEGGAAGMAGAGGVGGVAGAAGPGRGLPDRIKAAGESAAAAISNVGETFTYSLAHMMEDQAAAAIAATHRMTEMLEDQANTSAAAIEQVGNASATSVRAVVAGSEAATETVLSNHLGALRGRWNSLTDSIQAWQPDPLRDLGTMFDLGTGYLTNPQGGVDAALRVLQEIRDLIGETVNGPRLNVEGADVGGL